MLVGFARPWQPTLYGSPGNEGIPIGPRSNIHAGLYRSILSHEMIVNDFVAVLTRVLRLRAILVLVGVSAWLLLAGCQILGPAALSTGRGAYNDVIARTNSEQTLGLIVRLRYSDPIGLLAVSSVTASLKFSTQAKGEAGFGSPASYAGALFRSGGGQLRGRPLDLLHAGRRAGVPARMARARQAGDAGAGDTGGAVQDLVTLLLGLVERMNGLRLGAGATVEERTAFHRVATLLAQFRELGIGLLVQESGATDATS